MPLTPTQLDAIAAFQDAAHARRQLQKELVEAGARIVTLNDQILAADQCYSAAHTAMREALLEEK